MSEKQGAFAPGQRIGWSHAVGTKHGTGSVLRSSALTSDDPTARIGVVTEAGEVDRNLFEVLLDGDEQPCVLTADELVRVEEEK